MPITIAGSGTITGLSAGGLPANSITSTSIADNAITSGKLASGVGGKILQVVQSTKLDHFRTDSETYIDVPGTDQAGSGSVWCCKITPSAATSKVLVTVSLSTSCSDSGQVKMLRDSTDIYKGTVSLTDGDRNCTGGIRQGNNNEFNMLTWMYLDSPSSTSEKSYKIQIMTDNNSVSDMNVNRREVDATFSFASSIICQEIAA